MPVRLRKLDSALTRNGVRAVSTPSRSLAPLVIAGLICGMSLLTPARMSGQDDEGPEYRVKLAFLLNFAQFIEWPPEDFAASGAPLEICVAGPDPFAAEAEQEVRKRRMVGHPIEIKRLRPADNPRSCQMIFVRAGESKSTQRLFAAVKSSDIVTVGETKGFALRGGMINFTPQGNKLRFEINVDAAAETRLKISSKLLALASIVGRTRVTPLLAGGSPASHEPGSRSADIDRDPVRDSRGQIH
jgi:hypothetical protein